MSVYSLAGIGHLDSPCAHEGLWQCERRCTTSVSLCSWQKPRCTINSHGLVLTDNEILINIQDLMKKQGETGGARGQQDSYGGCQMLEPLKIT